MEQLLCSTCGNVIAVGPVRPHSWPPLALCATCQAATDDGRVPAP